MITLLAVLVGGFAGAIARQEGFSVLQERAQTRFPVTIAFNSSALTPALLSK